MAASDTFLVPSFGTSDVILFIVITALLIAVPIWVFGDAQCRGDSGLAWSLVAFFLGPIGWAIYLAQRRPLPSR